MTVIAALIPVSLGLGLLGLAAFVWSLKAHQYDDLEGDQHRALFGGNDDAPPP
jgi:cbb3-type cytochrome oxidase maturation protein